MQKESNTRFEEQIRTTLGSYSWTKIQFPVAEWTETSDRLLNGVFQLVREAEEARDTALGEAEQWKTIANSIRSDADAIFHRPVLALVVVLIWIGAATFLKIHLESTSPLPRDEKKRK